jgi:hypothetical protein
MPAGASRMLCAPQKMKSRRLALAEPARLIVNVPGVRILDPGKLSSRAMIFGPRSGLR